MQFTIREMPDRWWRNVLAVVAFGLLLAFLAPFGSQQSLSPLGRTIFWPALVAVGSLLAWSVDRALGRQLPHSIARKIAVAVLSSLPQLFVVGWALVQVRPGRVITPGDLPMLYLAVLSIQLPIAFLPLLFARSETTRGDDHATNAPRGRLARHGGDDIVALEAEDHYVRVHRSTGSTLVLHRLGDAIDELDPAIGLQVHRGWWVAHDAVVGTFLRSEKRWLLLSNGLQVPVSRTHLRAVNACGWSRIAPPDPA